MKQDHLACLMRSFSQILGFVRANIKDRNIPAVLSVLQRHIGFAMSDGANFALFEKDILRALGSRDISPISERCRKASTDHAEEIRNYLPLLNYVVADLLRLIKVSNYDKAYDLACAVSGLPEALLRKDDWRPKDFWKNQIRPFRKKWDDIFLLEYEKALLKPPTWTKIFQIG